MIETPLGRSRIESRVGRTCVTSASLYAPLQCTLAHGGDIFASLATRCLPPDSPPVAHQGARCCSSANEALGLSSHAELGGVAAPMVGSRLTGKG